MVSLHHGHYSRQVSHKVQLGPLLFFIYINDLPDELESLKLFANDCFLFSTFHDPSISAGLMNDYIKIFLEWVYKWKMLFHPDVTK